MTGCITVTEEWACFLINIDTNTMTPVFKKKKKFYCGVGWQGDRRQSSNPSPHSGVWDKFSGLETAGWYAEVLAGRF